MCVSNHGDKLKPSCIAQKNGISNLENSLKLSGIQYHKTAGPQISGLQRKEDIHTEKEMIIKAELFIIAKKWKQHKHL